ncbi:hypothetical protein [Rhodovulum marinum]|uniref:hypothetical protein n=1 Tax=Rhodovulum marinum TaxID=320662 RepID=UPI00104F00C2|nr:hypothetical protein [Rhodovulum marinum]
MTRQTQIDEAPEALGEIDGERRAALRRLGALAGGAPAVALLLAPSASRAEFIGSCVDASNCPDLGDVDDDDDDRPQL